MWQHWLHARGGKCFEPASPEQQLSEHAEYQETNEQNPGQTPQGAARMANVWKYRTTAAVELLTNGHEVLMTGAGTLPYS